MAATADSARLVLTSTVGVDGDACLGFESGRDAVLDIAVSSQYGIAFGSYQLRTVREGEIPSTCRIYPLPATRLSAPTESPRRIRAGGGFIGESPLFCARKVSRESRLRQPVGFGMKWLLLSALLSISVCGRSATPAPLVVGQERDGTLTADDFDDAYGVAPQMPSPSRMQAETRSP